MATIHPLNAKKREGTGTSAAKKLRREGRVPGVVYGGDQDNYGVDLDGIAIRDLLASSASDNILVRLDIEGAKEQGKLALIQAVQHHPLASGITHLDFRVVHEDDEIAASVPIELIGESIGVKNGGLLDQQLLAVEVRCKPADLPEKVQGDITDVEIGKPLHIGGVSWPKGVTCALGDDVVVAIVSEVRALIAAAAAGEEGAEAAEGGEAAEAAEGDAA